MLLDRLRGRAEVGLNHLFDILKNMDRRVTRADLPALENGLLRCDAKTAVAAAQWCEVTASGDDAWLAGLIKQATSHWIEHEEPVGGPLMPDSPREALLRIWCRIKPPAFDELAGLAGDSRWDVRKAALDGMIGLAVSSVLDRSSLVEYIMAGRFPAEQCEQLLGGAVPYSAEDLATLRGLCWHLEAKYRRVAAKHLLTHPGVDTEEARIVAEAMKTDKDLNVRDYVNGFLEQKFSSETLDQRA